ncbi:hypothetical protein [Hydrogenivirga sp.]
MKKLTLVLALAVGSVFAEDYLLYPSFKSNSGPRPYKDAWGNSYKNYDNMWKDSDGDGVINYYDYNDRNPNVQTPYQRGLGGWDW